MRSLKQILKGLLMPFAYALAMALWIVGVVWIAALIPVSLCIMIFLGICDMIREYVLGVTIGSNTQEWTFKFWGFMIDTLGSLFFNLSYWIVSPYKKRD